MEKIIIPEAIIEPLTRRERVILEHLAENKSNREIAATETLALSSVKWFVHQIYAKLGVSQRSAAVERAQELGLLKPVPARKKNNLPTALTSFIGRQKEIGELRQLLKKKETRLLTVTGSGGTGKTRLALQVASEVEDGYPDGVFVVELAPLADPQLVANSVRSVLGLVEQSERSPLVLLESYLQDKHLLLILDNCEHLVEACAELAGRLLQAAPRLTILATSREILGVEGEIPYRVPPMGTPDPNHSMELEEIAQYEAVRLFLERGRVVSPHLILTQENASEMVEVCRRLDGIPLAIELAAARLGVLSVGQITERLDDVFHLLTGGSRTRLPRHQTLRALIDWSYYLLTEREKRLLRALSVFAGGWTLEAAEEVCKECGGVLDLLGDLADKSLIQVTEEPGGEMRYRMLEMVRQYALEKLKENGEEQAQRGNHLGYFLRLGERLEPKLRSSEQIPTLERLDQELDNLRQALEWGLREDVESELRLAAALMWFWSIRNHWAEGITWLERGLEAEKRSGGGQVLVRAKALTALGFHLTQQNYFSELASTTILEEALALYRASQIEDRRGLAWALRWLADCYWKEGDLPRSIALTKEGLALFRQIGDAHGMAECLAALDSCEKDPRQKRKIYQEVLAIEEANGDTDGIGYVYTLFGVADLADGYYEKAQGDIETALVYFQRVGARYMLSHTKHFYFTATLFNGEMERAAACLEESLAYARRIGFQINIFTSLFWQTTLAETRGQYDLAAELIEEASSQAQKMGDPWPHTHVLYQRAHLARLSGDVAGARRYAEEGVKAELFKPHPILLLLVELGHLALEEGDLGRAGEYWREAMRSLIQCGFDLRYVGWELDGLALLAVRRGRLEQAATLFNTRHWGGYSHTLAPQERAAREADLQVVKAALGEERYLELAEESQAIVFDQMMALIEEELRE